MQIDFNALANFVEVLDCNAEYEDDTFAFDFAGERIYCERKSRHFNLHIGSEVLQMPR
ncbi:hypothetical protein [Sphingomonas hankookensis]|uniref:hypothetical protein n=1 Tax=Sphingomonas hankookensis TaxID=563996 RepID=UPI00234EDB69|nr:hypothetical protein [Sphingomonas hankookensis]WCP72203.1 hypothetical protein PPZ50_01155 [Sphingomonas hankookensis]